MEELEPSSAGVPRSTICPGVFGDCWSRFTAPRAAAIPPMQMRL